MPVEKEEKPRAKQLEQKTRDQQDRIRTLIRERKKNKAVVNDLQTQIEALNAKLDQTDKKSNANAHRNSSKIRELVAEVENLSSIVQEYKQRAQKLKKSLADEMSSTELLS